MMKGNARAASSPYHLPHCWVCQNTKADPTAPRRKGLLMATVSDILDSHGADVESLYESTTPEVPHD